MIVVKVTVNALGDVKLHPDDQGLDGVYYVAVDCRGADPAIAGYALDAFHNTVPIKVLDHFLIDVLDLDDRILVEPDGYESGSNLDRATVLLRQSEFSIPTVPDMLWKCLECGRVILHDYDAICNVGNPICGDCDQDMERV